MLFAAGLWGLVVLAGLVGWGTVLCKLIRPGAAVHWSLRAALGFSLGVVVGGVLGQFGLIHPATEVGFILIGAAWLLPSLRAVANARLPRLLPLELFLSAVLIPLVLLRYAAAIYSPNWELQWLDDLPAYLVFPVKMLQTGTFAADPFSDRRMLGLGGQQWAQGLVISLFGPNSVNLFDRGVMLIVLLGMVYWWMTKIGVRRPFSLCVMILLMALYPFYLNCCSFITMSVLILSLFICVQDSQRTWRDAVLLALLAAAACSLKGTFIAFTGMILAAWFLYETAGQRSIRPLFFAAATAIITVAMLFPWMLAMHRSSGTYLFPYLGKGNSLLPSFTASTPRNDRIGSIIMALLTAGAGLLAFYCAGRRKEHRRWAITAMIFAAAIAPVICIITLQTGGTSWYRFPQPVLYGLLPIPLASLGIWSQAGQRLQRLTGQAAAMALGVALLFSTGYWLNSAGHGLTSLGPLRAVWHEVILVRLGIHWKPLADQAAIDRMLAMQRTVPAGAAILERLDLPHLLDFKRNPVFICDHPNFAAPPPALPTNPTPEQLRAYLLERNVHYIAYSYGDQADFPEGPRYSVTFPWLLDQLVDSNTVGMQKAILKLSRLQQLTYDNGWDMVIDLDHPRTATSANPR